MLGNVCTATPFLTWKLQLHTIQKENVEKKKHGSKA
jgi:hypothetical protein